MVTVWQKCRNRLSSASTIGRLPRKFGHSSYPKFNACNIIMLGSTALSPARSYFERRSRRIKDGVVKDAINLSLAWKRPDFSFGGVTASSASRFMEGSARV
jgi:hypothetical protein